MFLRSSCFFFRYFFFSSEFGCVVSRGSILVRCKVESVLFSFEERL